MLQIDGYIPESPSLIAIFLFSFFKANYKHKTKVPTDRGTFYFNGNLVWKR